MLRGEVRGLRVENDELRAAVAARDGIIAGLRARVQKLADRVEELRRAAKRQAAPFSRDTPKAHRRRPGRRPGPGYGTRSYRRVPDHVDEIVRVPLPPRCACGGQIVPDRVVVSHQEDIPPVRPFVTRYETESGVCRSCGRRTRARHPGQVSDASGAAGSHLGPRAVALACWLNKSLGIPAGKVAAVLHQTAGLEVTAGGVHQLMHRTARRLEPTYDALVEGIRNSPAVSPDETGWRVGGYRAWLWVFVGQGVTVYHVADGRGYEQAAVILGEEYSGVLERDGWHSYRRFTSATHQTCLAHLLRRMNGMIADSVGGQARVPHAARRILHDALALREARDQGALEPGALEQEVDALGERMDELLGWSPTHEPNDRLLDHLWRERDHLFTFLTCPGTEATNWRSEQGIRPMVVARKNWGGNAEWRGARTTEVLASVLRTAHQQGRDPVGVLLGALRSPTPVLADLLIPGRAPPTP